MSAALDELTQMLEPLKVEARANLNQARKNADAAGPGRRLLRVDLLSLRRALLDPVLGEAMHQAMFAAFAASQGVAGGPCCDCLVCGGHWAKARLPGMAATIRSGLFGSGHERSVGARFAAARPLARLGR